MPFIFIYAASDFVTAPPAEQDGAAAGTPPYSLTLSPGASRVNVEVDDTDGRIDEITGAGSQTFTNTVTIGGVTYPAGTTYHGAYDLINSSTGHKVTSLTLGGDGREQGAVQGIVSTIPLEPGTTYTFNQERSSYQQTTNTYDTYEAVPCFTAGSMIETDQGARPVEELAVGDLVRTRDHGLQPVRWIGSRGLEAADLMVAARLRPIRISAGALGHGVPETDLLVSPQHRVLVRSRIAQRMFGDQEVLIAAKHLTHVDGIEIAGGVRDVTYFHVLFDRHEIVFANGAETESLFTGPQALKSIGKKARAEIFELFPELRNVDFRAAGSRRFVNRRESHKLAERHQKNARRLVA